MKTVCMLCLGLLIFCFKASAEPGFMHEASAHNCDVAIVNDGHLELFVFGVLDNGSALKTFKMTKNENSRYIDLYDESGRCHEGMSLFVLSSSGKAIYSAYTETNTTIHLVLAPT